jgi:hypothetical protein
MDILVRPIQLGFRTAAISFWLGDSDRNGSVSQISIFGLIQWELGNVSEAFGV